MFTDRDLTVFAFAVLVFIIAAVGTVVARVSHRAVPNRWGGWLALACLILVGAVSINLMEACGTVLVGLYDRPAADGGRLHDRFATVEPPVGVLNRSVILGCNSSLKDQKDEKDEGRACCTRPTLPSRFCP